LAPRHRDNAGAHFGERQRGNLPYSRRCTGDDNGLALHDARGPAASCHVTIVTGFRRALQGDARLRRANPGLAMNIADAVHRTVAHRADAPTQPPKWATAAAALFAVCRKPVGYTTGL